jgi:hypoxanthine phosphoribosyltransferase
MNAARVWTRTLRPASRDPLSPSGSESEVFARPSFSCFQPPSWIILAQMAETDLLRERSRSAISPLPGEATPRVPARWRREVDHILITETEIARRLPGLARQIQRDFAGRELVIVSLLNGTVMFLADLIRHLPLPLRLDFLGVSSYGPGTESGDLVFTKDLRLDVRGRDILLVDDILDTGKTLSRVLARLGALRPRRIRTCVLLDKAARRTENVQADYVGFEIPDFFVVGYGLDFAERYRNLPFIGVLRPEVYKSPPVRPPRAAKQPPARARSSRSAPCA